MRISQAVAEEKPLAVDFKGATLNVVYRPLTYTVREMDALGESKDTERIIKTMLRLLVSWDLTDENDTPVPIETEPLRDVPTHIFTGIIKAVGKDQAPDPEA